MLNFLKNTFLFALIILSGSAVASTTQPGQHDQLVAGDENHQNSTTHTEKEFDAAAHAIHHALDAHEIHIADGFVIPLPVILWTDNGLVTFMSSEFHHDDEGHHVVSKNGMNFIKMHEKIYQLEAGEEHVSLEGHLPINTLGVIDLSITKNVAALFLVAGLLLFVFIRSAKYYKSGVPSAPKGIAKWTEPGVIFVQAIAKENIHGHKHEKFTPYLLTVFFFIFFGNLLGLIPFLSNPNLTGSISITLMLATFTFAIQMINSKKGYWSHLVDPLGKSLPWYGKMPLYLILVPIEIAGIFIKPAALMIRLFANITAGHIIVVSLIAIIFVNQSVGWAGLSVPMALFISTLELLVAFLQAYIFTMLSAMYIGSSVEEAHH
ncbi:MAG: F0F1 ATP synthase subunit A [Bacteroidetes bacterium]|nr:F0F1 ATP synthase subunit A [Bacteroidota bacterium]